MKKKIFKLCFIAVFLQAINIAICDDPPTQDEIILVNNSSSTSVTVQIYPLGLTMNGFQQYSLIARRQLTSNPSGRIFNYDNGVRVDNNIKQIFIPVSSGTPGLNYDGGDDGADPNQNSSGSFGRGTYMIKFVWQSGSSILSDSTLYEQDAGRNYDIEIILVNNTSQYGGPNASGLVYKSWLDSAGWGPEQWVGLTNRYFQPPLLVFQKV